MSRTIRNQPSWAKTMKRDIDSGILDPDPRSPWANGRDGIFSDAHSADTVYRRGYNTFDEVGRGKSKRIAKRAASKARRHINYEE